MNSNVRIVQNLATQPNRQNSSAISNGSRVTGRVIAQNSDGTYSVSLAGQKINVRSELGLVPGQVFSARTDVKNGTVFLSLEGMNGKTAEIVSQLSLSEGGRELPENIQNFLANLGLKPEFESFRLLQFMQQLGMKINLPQARKSLKTAERFSENKEEAAAMSFLLSEKGLPDDADAVKSVVGNGENSGQDRKNQDENPLISKQLLLESVDFDEDSGKKFTEEFMDEVDEASEKNRNGILSAFNTVKNHKTYSSRKTHWFVLPYEWPAMQCFGDIRLFYDLEKMVLQKIVIKCKKEVQNLVFMLELKDSTIDFVKFAVDSVSASSKKDEMEQMLRQLLNRCSIGKNLTDVTMVDYQRLTGFCSDETPLTRVQGLL